VLPSFICANVIFSDRYNFTVICRPSVVPLLHSVTDIISQCVAVLQLCHCYIQWPTKFHNVFPSFSCATVTFSDRYNFTVCCRPSVVSMLHSVTNTITQSVAVLQLCHCYIQRPKKFHSVLPSFSCATVILSARYNFTVCCRHSLVPLLHSVTKKFHSVLPSFSCATVIFSAQQNFTVRCPPSVVPLIHSVPKINSQWVAVLQLCHCYIQCPTQYHSVLPSISCATVTFSDQQNITVSCRPSIVPLYIQWPTQYHSVLPPFSCATVTFSDQNNITVCCRPSVMPLLHSVPNTISQCVAVLHLFHCYIQCPT